MEYILREFSDLLAVNIHKRVENSESISLEYKDL